jgi:hypothetical protein
VKFDHSGLPATAFEFQRDVDKKQTWLNICTWPHLYEETKLDGITVHGLALLRKGLFGRQS